MNDHQLLERITVDPKIMVGKPAIKGTRLTVEYILNLMAHGATVDEIVTEYKGLTAEDIQACVLFAKNALALPAIPGNQSREVGPSAAREKRPWSCC
jgi:uncharacterized protein (DUF433 family)